MKTTILLDEIQAYWGRRAESFSADVSMEDSDRWMDVIQKEIPGPQNIRVLDIGTGPGFFAIGLAKRGYNVTAVDLTPEMLAKARENAGPYADSIHFLQMDAQHLDFVDNQFDVITTRNLVWNLEDPGKAYKEWFRVLRPGGVLLNFDANWYRYLFDEETNGEKILTENHLKEEGKTSQFDAYEESDQMEEIARHLKISRLSRPMTDLALLDRAGFSRVTADKNIWEKVWSEQEQDWYRFTPCFMVKAHKGYAQVESA